MPAAPAVPPTSELRLSAIDPRSGERVLLKLFFDARDDDVKAALETCAALGYRRPRVSRTNVTMAL
jgi:hypothetical protein